MSDTKNPQPDTPDSNQEEILENASEATIDADPGQVDESSLNEAEGQNSDAQNLEQELADAQTEIAKLKDAFLRAKAEEDNVRRRTEKEVANSRKFAVEGFAKEMLSVYDSLKLALNAQHDEAEKESVKGLYEGVEITLKQLQTAMGKFGVEEIVPEVGAKLDPNLHQAMSMIESDDVESGGIINVIQSGFQLHDRLLRAAMVVVAK